MKKWKKKKTAANTLKDDCRKALIFQISFNFPGTRCNRIVIGKMCIVVLWFGDSMLMISLMIFVRCTAPSSGHSHSIISRNRTHTHTHTTYARCVIEWCVACLLICARVRPTAGKKLQIRFQSHTHTYTDR